MRFLFLVLIVVAGVLIWRALRKGNAADGRGDAPTDRPAEKAMVQCRQCGVYLPQDEAIAQGAFHYCCIEHQETDRQRPPSN